jgi:glycosyltransferase involved in cell wall biosynthesis
MIHQSKTFGYDNYLVAGVSSGWNYDVAFIEKGKSLFVNFCSGDISCDIPGMSDVMPYESSRFCDLSPKELAEYEDAFSKTLSIAVKEFKPDIIHSHHLWIVSSLARQLFPDIPMVTTCHGTDLRQFQNCPHLQEKVLQGCRKINMIMALTEAQKDEIIGLYKVPTEKVIVVGVGYNDKLFYLGAKPNHGPIQLVYAGKLSKAKGVPWFLHALSSINSPAWQLHLIGGGSGEEKEHCLTLAKELGGRVHIYGALPHEDLAEIMRRSHILVLPSFFEGLPVVILEGLACGCRIVATDLPGIREVIGNSYTTDLITLIRTPRLRHIDQPYMEDEYSFEQDLKNAIQKQLDASHNYKEIDLSPIQDKLKAHTQKGIFEKVREVYLKCLN